MKSQRDGQIKSQKFPTAIFYLSLTGFYTFHTDHIQEDLKIVIILKTVVKVAVLTECFHASDLVVKDIGLCLDLTL